ncbi:Na(+)/H(+) antiporter subunit C [Nocardiopsis sp. NPDC006198]|uniref:Na(+)/H(+) antiporter subunit C n=1 Tax=Streptomonospora nanhaiensis TaxID=1323731 RepID=A0ABY6YLG1_9ACTN|nr:Na(+)/H(+) antiporter subunit C [Streptomonospora nanhaiensis]MEE2043389.1 Na(+)/H(+) antiporter subunit C [Nocardiopsis tropica]WAE73129.1 Na(+)/H(+) antiporter subunit C [Streptomonospora nanhaiensis]
MNESPSLILVVLVGVLVAVGVVLLLERSLTRVLLGFIVMSNGVNLMILSMAGEAGEPPILWLSEPEEMTDPLPQAMILTAIVITLGITAFLLAMAYRNWQLEGNDEVQDDAEDIRIVQGEGRRAVRQRFAKERRRLQADIRRQRAELQATIAAADAQELAEQARIKAEIAAAQAELARYEVEAEESGPDERSQETMRRLTDRTESMTAQVQELRGRIRLGRRRLREHRRADRAAERELWRELRRRIRSQRRQARQTMSAERERLARAEDSDLQGSD